MSALCIALPRLHEKFDPPAPGVLRLWPGLPDPPSGAHVPENFPLSPQEAALYLEEVRGLGAAVAAKIPVHTLLAEEKRKRDPGRKREEIDLAAFAEGVPAPQYDVFRLREAKTAAQKALLRIWLLEEQQGEIAALEGEYNALSGSMSAALGVEADDEEAGALRLAQTEDRFTGGPEAAAPWRMVTENACFFMPEHSPLFFDDPAVCADLREAGLAFASAPEFAFAGAPAPGKAEAPLWKALGLPGPRPERPWLERIFIFVAGSAA